MSRIIKCKICGEVKELAGKGMCQSCYNKKRYEENKEQLKEQSKKYREENKEQLKERRKKNYEENREHNLEYQKKYRAENPELCKERIRKYREENLELCRERSKKHRYAHGGLSASENRSCASFLGEHVTENVLSKVFKNVHRMPPQNPGYDFRCSKGMKVDVKSSTLHNGGSWSFRINKNTVADYFICLAFDNITDLNPLRMWLIPGKDVNHLIKVGISPSKTSKWKEYELDVEKVVDCCDSMKK